MLELTESALVEPDSATVHNLDAIRRAGVVVALDAFGTGYSSLSSLARFPVDVLKLDESFLAGDDEGAAQARLVEGIAALASTLGIPLVAKGVERPAQVARLLDHGVTRGQGFLLGAPMDAEALARRLASRPTAGTKATRPRLRLVG